MFPWSSFGIKFVELTLCESDRPMSLRVKKRNQVIFWILKMSFKNFLRIFFTMMSIFATSNQGLTGVNVYYSNPVVILKEEKEFTFYRTLSIY